MEIKVQSNTADEEQQIKSLKLCNLVEQYFNVKRVDARTGYSYALVYYNNWPLGVLTEYKLLSLDVSSNKATVKINQKFKLCECSMKSFCEKLGKLMRFEEVEVTYSDFKRIFYD